MILSKFKYLKQTKKFHEKKYNEMGLKYQRQHPNEDVIRFVNKNFTEKQFFFLDVGCGSGRHLNFIKTKGHKVEGLDFSFNALKLLKNNKKNKHQKLIYDSLPLMKKVSNARYDVVIDCFTSYTLIQKDFYLYLKNVFRVLKDNGKFHLQAFSTKSDLFRNYLPSKKVFKFSLASIKRFNSPFPNDDYLFTFYNKSKIKNLLSKSGFCEINIETHSRTYRNSNEYIEYFVIDSKKNKKV